MGSVTDASVRRTGGVDVKLGQRIAVDGRPSTVVSSSSSSGSAGETDTSRTRPAGRVNYQPTDVTQETVVPRPPSKAQIAREHNLSATDVDYLQLLAFREGLKPGPCWVYHRPRNRWAILVPTVFGHYERHTKFIRNGSALARLERHGWIVYGPDGALPTPYEREWGSTIALTDKARGALNGRETSA